ncbi:DNA-processing protein DprA [Nocardioides sp. Kera G14]|uniref:DNA-processing protein DprA n=1 Tax=Nocardioides sp. Kera G14 TaxID=2884264 RepID=UPI001D123AAD|nr:DNA-processing protein DprA [Nocardioides sp. Kera G14]UDY22634.1 DNA-processing protein DprA [Nocardioides sp. Kera G14]
MSASEQDWRSRLVLSLIFEPGDTRIEALVKDHGAAGALALVQESLVAPEVLTESGQRLAEVRPDAVLEHAAQVGARFIVPGDSEWPGELADLEGLSTNPRCGGVPLGLWVKGQPLNTLGPRLAIVGSRASTTYGTQASGMISAECASAGWVVVSGGAYGIDEAAHRNALAVGGRTIVALAHGLDRAYPIGNSALIERAAETGALISELAPGTAPMRQRFLSRNRVIAALAVGTLVVEADIRSGALSTARWAARLSRHVLAVPGPTSSAVSRGTHELIRSGGAVLASTGAEVLEVIDPTGSSLLEEPRAPEKLVDRLTWHDRQLLEAVPWGRPQELRRIALTAGIGIVDAQGSIGRLADRGLVRQDAGGWCLSEAGRARSA